MNTNTNSTALLFRSFELEVPEDPMSEEELFNLLADQIAYMIEYRLEFLLSLMYRHDVLEENINKALSPGNPDPANIALARLVMDRQKQKVQTKKEYEVKEIEDLEEGLKL